MGTLEMADSHKSIWILHSYLLNTPYYKTDWIAYINVSIHNKKNNKKIKEYIRSQRLPGAFGGFGKAILSDFGILSRSVGANHSGTINSWFLAKPNLVAMPVTLPLSFLGMCSSALSSVILLPAICCWPDNKN